MLTLVNKMYRFILCLLFPYYHKPFYPRRLAKIDTTRINHECRNRPKPEWVKTQIIHTKAIMGDNVGCRKIAESFNHSNDKGETVGKTYVANIIAKYQYEIHIERRKIKNKLPRWIAVNCTWAMDLSFYTTGNHITNPFLGIIDHGSRKSLTLQTLVNKSSWTLLGYLCLAIGKYGKPKKLRTDNEIIFTSFVFRTFLKLVNIQHQRIPPLRRGAMAESNDYLVR